MGYNIGPKIGIDGEAEFRKQIRDINAEYKALEAETKALTAAFEANGDEQGKLEGTSKVLEKQITSQKNKIDLLEDALQKATAKYGENSVEAIRLQGAIYDTQATLTGLETELQDTIRRLGESGAAMSDAEAEALRLTEAEARIKKELADSDSEYKAIVAETRSLAAAYDTTGDQTDNLRQSCQQLEKQIDSQKRKIELLESAVEIAAQKYGKNSSEANKLRASLYDTQTTLTGLEGELKDTNRRLEETANGMEEFQEETEGAGDAALDFSDILGANFIADAAKDALDEVIDAVVEFAKEMPEAASEVNAANSQFEQTFKELEGTARSALQSISDETGIAASRMQENYTQLYAFTKSVGGDSAEALDIASRAMIAAADNAAYYDKSIEEATEQLQSFIKGNYENDSALGISATETARNTKANELYAKSFNELSEAQKVDVLLAMVEAGNKASGALGQAAREADSWTNVQGELDEAMRQFQATLGSPVLEAVIPVIKGITESIYDLIETADWQVLQTGIDDFTDSMENAEKQFQNTAEETESAAYIAEYYVKRLEELEAAGLNTTDAQREYAGIVQELNVLIPDLNLSINEQTGLIEQSTSAIRVDIQAWKDRAVAQAMQEKLTEQLRAYGQAEADIYEAKVKMTTLEAEEADLKRRLAELTGGETKETNLFTLALQANSEAFLNSADGAAGLASANVTLTGAAAGSRDEVALLEKQLADNQIQQMALTDTIQTGEETLITYQEQLEKAEDALTLFNEETANGTEDQNALDAKIQALQLTLKALEIEYSEAKSAARDSIDAQIGLFDKLSDEAKMTTDEIVLNWLDQQAAFDNYAANLQKAVDMGLDQALIQQLADGSEESMLILDGFVNDTGMSVDEINAAFRGLSKARDIAADAMVSVTTGLKEEIDKVSFEMYSAGYSLGTQVVNGAVAGIDENKQYFSNSMRSMANTGEKSFKEAMVIQSPSRVMIDANEDVVAGAVLGVERNIADYEAAMADLGTSGYWAYLDERADLAESFPSIMDSLVMPTANQVAPAINYGGFEIHIYQQAGEDPEDLVYRFMDVLQQEFDRKGASWGAYK